MINMAMPLLAPQFLISSFSSSPVTLFPACGQQLRIHVWPAGPTSKGVIWPFSCLKKS